MLQTGDCHRRQGHLSASPTANVTGWMVIHSLLPTGSHLPPCAPCTLSFLPCLARHDSSHGSQITRMCLAALTNARIDKGTDFLQKLGNFSVDSGIFFCKTEKNNAILENYTVIYGIVQLFPALLPLKFNFTVILTEKLNSTYVIVLQRCKSRICTSFTLSFALPVALLYFALTLQKHSGLERPSLLRQKTFLLHAQAYGTGICTQPCPSLFCKLFNTTFMQDSPACESCRPPSSRYPSVLGSP